MRGHLSRADVLARYAIKSDTLCHWVASGRLPPPSVRHSQRRQWWRESVLDDWDRRSERMRLRTARRAS